MKQTHNIFISTILYLCFFFQVSVCFADMRSDFEHAYTLNKQGNIEQACTLFHALVERHPESTQAIFNYAHTLKDLGYMQESAQMYQKVIDRESENAHAHIGLAQCYLALGDFARGWPLFEWRNPLRHLFKPYIDYAKKVIENNQSFNGKRILIRAEWGLGDTLQFIRFASELKQRGATIIYQSYKQLQPLLKLCPYLDQVIAVGDAFPEHDIQLPLLSLPYILNTTLSTITPLQPYVIADPIFVEHWKTILAHDTKFKIGICWQGKGDPHAPALLQKNIPLESFEPLFSIPAISIYSLQYLDTTQTIQLHSNLHTFDKEFDVTHGRFMDTAAVMHSLDLIITMDTSIAHLAGAMNRPVWLLLPYRCDWRWMLDRTDSPWYPSMRLVRQPRPGDWKSVITEIKEEINKRKST